MFPEFFSHLYAQQTSPVETLIFTLLSVLVFMAMALVFYVAMVVLMWKIRFDPNIRLHGLFFPSGPQFKEYLGEYGLAASTSLVLATTLQLKHRIVDTILNTPVRDLTVGVGELFPLRVLPPGLEDQAMGLTVETLTQPLIRAGQGTDVALLQAATEHALENAGLAAFFLSESTLVGISIVLGLIYLTWLAIQQLQKAQDPDTEFGGYGATVRRVFLLATCVALLLASPVLVTPQSLSDSAHQRAVIAAADAAEDPITARLEQEIVRQEDLFRYLEAFGSGDEVPDDLVGTILDLGRSLADFQSEITPRVGELEAGVAGLAGRLNEAEGSARNLGGEVADLGTRLEEAEQELRDAAAESARTTAALDALISDLDAMRASDEQLRDAIVRIEEEHVRSLEALAQRLAAYASVGSVEEIRASIERVRSDAEAATQRLLELIRSQENAGPETGFVVVVNDAECSFTLGGNGVSTPASVSSSTWPVRPGTYTVAATGANCAVDVNAAGYQVARGNSTADVLPAGFITVGQRAPQRTSLTIGAGDVRVVRVTRAIVVQ